MSNIKSRKEIDPSIKRSPCLNTCSMSSGTSSHTQIKPIILQVRGDVLPEFYNKLFPAPQRDVCNEKSLWKKYQSSSNHLKVDSRLEVLLDFALQPLSCYSHNFNLGQQISFLENHEYRCLVKISNRLAQLHALCLQFKYHSMLGDCLHR